MRSAKFGRRRSSAVVLGAGVVALSLVAASAGAAVLAGDDPAALAGAMAGTATTTGASLAVDYPCVADDPATPEDDSSCPTGVGTTPLAGFPTNGSTFGIITSGDAAIADDPNDDVGAGKNWGVSGAVIGPDVFDHQIVRIDLGPATGTCFAFDFRFLSEEFPEFLNKGYNDAFVAQLNTWAVSIDPSTQGILAPGNFAAGAGDIISVDGAGPSAMTPEQAAGTTYDGATLSLIARTPVASGSTNSLYLTIFDQGDGIFDSAVFVDNLRYETLPPGQCKSLAVDPFEGTTGVVLSPGGTGTFAPDFSTLTIPLTSNLPTGPIATDLTATATFVNWGDVVPRKSARQAKATTNLASGFTKIPAGGSGNLVMTTTPEGVAAIQAAKAQPATLLAQAKQATLQAKKFNKSAKKLKKKAKKATGKKAKKLKKKAKKLVKKAKLLKKQSSQLTAQGNLVATQPLGTAVVTLTNPSNNKSELLRIQIPR